MQQSRDGGADDVDAAFADPAFAELKARGAPFAIVRPADGTVLWANAAAGEHWRADGPAGLARALFGTSGRGGWLKGLDRGLVPGRPPHLARGGFAHGLAMRPHTALIRAWTDGTGAVLIGFAAPDAAAAPGPDAWRRSAWAPDDAPALPAPADRPAGAARDGADPEDDGDGPGAELKDRGRLAVLRDRLTRAADGKVALRLLWRTDGDGALASVDAAAAARLGAALPFDGSTWPEVAARFDAAGAERLRAALAARETWSGIILPLPVADGAATAPLSLSASPAFGPDRAFAGYRGFGILDLGGLALSRRTSPAEDDGRDGARREPSDGVPDGEAADPRAGEADREAPRPPAADGTEPRAGAEPSGNVLPFRSPPDAPAAGAPGLPPSPAARGEAGRGSVAQEPGDGAPSDDQTAFLALGEALRARIGAVRDPAEPRIPDGAAPASAGASAAEPAAGAAPAATFDALDGTSGLPRADDRPDMAEDGDDERRDRADDAVALLDRADDAVALLDRVDDAVALLDASGRIRRINRRGEGWFDRPGAGGALGRDFADLLTPDSRAAAWALLGEVRAQRDGVAAPPLRRDVSARAGEGAPVPMLLTLGRLGASGFYATLRDNAALKRAETDRARTEHAGARAAERLPDLLAKVSHEVRTPLGSILGFAEVMMDERFGPLGNPRYKDYLRDIHAAGTRVVALVDDLLDLSRIEAGQIDLALGAVDVNRVVAESVAQMQPEAHRERVIMRTSLAGRIPQALTDERSARQIVRNLLSNAVKFNEPGGQVIVSTALGEGGAVLLRVRDTGVGMSDREIADALEPFGGLAARASGGGNGLGLPLTRALVGASGASMTIQSRPREGTLVEIAFPAADPAAARLPA